MLLLYNRHSSREVGIHLLSRNKLHAKPFSELMPPICYNIVEVQLPILLTTVWVMFLENTNAIISPSCFKHFNGILCPQDKIPGLFSGHEALCRLSSTIARVLSPSRSCLLPPVCHCRHLGVLSAPWMHQSFPNLLFEQKPIPFIFSKPVQIFCPSDLSWNTTPAGKSFLSFRLVGCHCSSFLQHPAVLYNSTYLNFNHNIFV